MSYSNNKKHKFREKCRIPQKTYWNTSSYYIHAIAGCYTTEYKFGVGKIKVIRKILKDQIPCNLNKYFGSVDGLQK